MGWLKYVIQLMCMMGDILLVVAISVVFFCIPFPLNLILAISAIFMLKNDKTFFFAWKKENIQRFFKN